MRHLTALAACALLAGTVLIAPSAWASSVVQAPTAARFEQVLVTGWQQRADPLTGQVADGARTSAADTDREDVPNGPDAPPRSVSEALRILALGTTMLIGGIGVVSGGDRLTRRR